MAKIALKFKRVARIIILKNCQKTKSDSVIDQLGWKPLCERCEKGIKELFNKGFKDKEHFPDLFKNYFNTRRSRL